MKPMAAEGRESCHPCAIAPTRGVHAPQTECSRIQ